MDIGASDFVLLLLYQRGPQGATAKQIETWVRPTMRANLRRTLNALEHTKAQIHESNGTFRITQSGQNYVESRQLMDPQKLS